MANFKSQWMNLSIKTKIAYVTAVLAFIIGWTLTVWGFIIGAGVVSDSVLWILGQALIYSASVFGVGMYVTSSVKNMKRSIRHFMHDERMGVHTAEEDDEFAEENEEEEI